MSWLVRWAGELVTKYILGKDVETAHERLKESAVLVANRTIRRIRPVFPTGRTKYG